jgi:hypothetical protein
VTGLFDRLGAAFVAPPSAETAMPRRGAGAAEERERAGEGRRPAGPTAVAIVCRPEDALIVGGAAALLLASRSRSTHALLAVWRGEMPSVRAPATGGARRLAATLASRGHDAAPTGRLAIVRLADELVQAAPEAIRAVAAARGVPGVVVLAGARDESADELLRAQDRVLVAAGAHADAHVATLAVAGLARLGVAVEVVELPAVPAPARALAASGVAVTPPLRGAVEAALHGGASERHTAHLAAQLEARG